jgi:hypothetical protein
VVGQHLPIDLDRTIPIDFEHDLRTNEFGPEQRFTLAIAYNFLFRGVKSFALVPKILLVEGFVEGHMIDKQNWLRWVCIRLPSMERLLVNAAEIWPSSVFGPFLILKRGRPDIKTAADMHYYYPKTLIPMYTDDEDLPAPQYPPGIPQSNDLTSAPPSSVSTSISSTPEREPLAEGWTEAWPTQPWTHLDETLAQLPTTEVVPLIPTFAKLPPPLRRVSAVTDLQAYLPMRDIVNSSTEVSDEDSTDDEYDELDTPPRLLPPLRIPLKGFERLSTDDDRPTLPSIPDFGPQLRASASAAQVTRMNAGAEIIRPATCQEDRDTATFVNAVQDPTYRASQNERAAAMNIPRIDVPRSPLSPLSPMSSDSEGNLGYPFDDDASGSTTSLEDTRMQPADDAESEHEAPPVVRARPETPVAFRRRSAVLSPFPTPAAAMSQLRPLLSAFFMRRASFEASENADRLAVQHLSEASRAHDDVAMASVAPAIHAMVRKPPTQPATASNDPSPNDDSDTDSMPGLQTPSSSDEASSSDSTHAVYHVSTASVTSSDWDHIEAASPSPHFDLSSDIDRSADSPYRFRLHARFARQLGKLSRMFNHYSTISFGDRRSTRKATSLSSVITPDVLHKFFREYRNVEALEQDISHGGINRWQKSIPSLVRFRHSITDTLDTAQDLVKLYGYPHGLRDYTRQHHTHVLDDDDHTHPILHSFEKQFLTGLQCFLYDIKCQAEYDYIENILTSTFQESSDLSMVSQTILKRLAFPNPSIGLEEA